MFRVFKKYFKKIDLFGAPIRFNIDGQEKYQSFLGAVSTIAMIVLIIVFFSSKIELFLAKVNIRSQSSENFSANPLNLTLTEKNFMFAVAIEQNSQYSYAQRPYYLIEMAQEQSINQKKNPNPTKIPLVPCTLARFQNQKSFKGNLTEMFNRLNFQNYLCPPDKFTLDLQGSYLSYNFSYITIRVNQCQNNSNSDWSYTCAPQTEIDKYMASQGSFRLNFYSNNFVINPELQDDDYSQSYISEDLNFQFQPGVIQRQVNVFFSNYQVESDTSIWVQNDINQNENFIFRSKASIQEKITMGNNQTDVSKSLTVYLRSDYYGFKATRRYQKVDELLSYFGGIFQLFLLIFGLIITAYNEKYFLLRISNKMFDYKELKDHIKKKKLEKRKKGHQVNCYWGRSEKNNKQKYEEEPNLMDVLDGVKMQQMGFKNRKEFFLWYFHRVFFEKSKLRLTWKYFVYFFSGRKLCTNTYTQLVDMGIERVREQMNLRNMLNQMEQVNKVKSIIMNNNQIVLFDYTAKPEISLNDKLQQQVTEDEAIQKLQNTKEYKKMTQEDLEKYRNLLRCFEKVLNTKTDDESTKILNKKLILCLGKELRNFFRAALLIKQYENDDNNEGDENQLNRKNSEIVQIERDFDKDNEDMLFLKDQYIQTMNQNNLK